MFSIHTRYAMHLHQDQSNIIAEMRQLASAVEMYDLCKEAYLKFSGIKHHFPLYSIPESTFKEMTYRYNDMLTGLNGVFKHEKAF